MIIFGKAHRQPFDDNVFDFEFSGIDCQDRSNWLTFKPGGFLFVLANTKDLYNLYSFLKLFNSSFRLISSCEIDSVDSSEIRQIVM
ncbi:hypothetical protein CFP56_001048 [Quercus suber]|uniref:Uncharacterized protein n=1 Tax=Quercus suber TaxID=58331 RepID=A0AAW0INW7_QUESU